MRMWLCNKKITTVGEVLTKPLTASQVSARERAGSKSVDPYSLTKPVMMDFGHFFL